MVSCNHTHILRQILFGSVWHSLQFPAHRHSFFAISSLAQYCVIFLEKIGSGVVFVYAKMFRTTETDT